MYATIEDCAARYGEDLITLLTDRGKTGQRNDTRLEQALHDAATEIDASLRQRYELPLPGSPELLKRVEIDMALYRLASEADLATEERRVRYDDAVKLLALLRRGEASLGLPGPTPEVARKVRSSGPDPVFGRDSMRGVLI